MSDYITHDQFAASVSGGGQETLISPPPSPPSVRSKTVRVTYTRLREHQPRFRIISQPSATHQLSGVIIAVLIVTCKCQVEMWVGCQSRLIVVRDYL